MPIAPYRRVLSVAAVRHALLLGVMVRIPLFAGGVLLTLHVVQTLGRSYTQAGLVAAAATVCVAVSGPWRGRLLDRIGLRRVVLPSLLVTAACWSIAPFVGYWPLVALASLAGLFVVPTFSIIRQAVIAAVPESDRRTALALDSVAVELAFMTGPVVGVWAATLWSTSWVLFGIEMVGVLAGAVLWWVDPPMTTASTVAADKAAARVPRAQWLTPGFVAVCAAAAAATIVLTGSDVSTVAALRHWHDVAGLGPVLAMWGLGSILGGLVYGALHQPIRAFLLLGGLSLATIPLAFAPGVWALGVLALVAGLLCAPTITATVDALSRIVPEAARGEAMGWHGSSMTAGSALGAPLGGVAIDRWGFGGGFLTVALFGLVVAVLVGGVTSVRRRRGGVPRSLQTTEPVSFSPGP